MLDLAVRRIPFAELLTAIRTDARTRSMPVIDRMPVDRAGAPQYLAASARARLAGRRATPRVVVQPSKLLR